MSNPPSTKPASPFAPLRRVVTGHTLSGHATVVEDNIQAARYFSDAATSPCYDLYYSSTTPAANDSELENAGGNSKWVDEVKEHPEIPPAAGGSNFRCWDMPPGSVTPMHRTLSLDYAVVLKGSVVLDLDNGERTVLAEGDTIVQRGTIHAWRNESDEWCRMLFVMIGAKPIEVSGNVLGEEYR
ncbi:Cupin-2 domain-containing protein [Mycena indigotica]|uniref:Cupin-2 domain-containing protein n=1 Tax=Mycena indigotica TaxID=2126181 RepID=A0A8H6SED8_9AGAR|nr:Cupin-2 domain-containing protein [Mycena indigotica]KAF7296802.1 Cupin-2 domain-containing protein [Mycena indigotica]